MQSIRDYGRELAAKQADPEEIRPALPIEEGVQGIFRIINAWGWAEGIRCIFIVIS